MPSRRTMPRMLPTDDAWAPTCRWPAGMVKAVDRAHEIGASALQIWGDNPTKWQRRAEPPADQAAFRARLAELDIGPIAIHASYLVNLAGPEDDLFGRSVGLLASELRAAPAYVGSFVNVHVGSHRGAGVPAGTRRLADGLALTLAEVDGANDERMPARIVLENSPGSGSRSGPTWTSSRASSRPSRAGSARAPRLLPRHSPRLGGRHRRVGPRRYRRLPRRFRRSDRARAAGHAPPQRLEVGVRLAARPARASGRRADRGRPDCGT